jgi:hypothetical protein
MKPTVKKLKDIRGRRIVGYRAHIGAIATQGSTPQEAAEKCEAAVHAALARLERGTLVGSWRGHTYVVSPTSEGWRYWLDTSSPYSPSRSASSLRRWRSGDVE